MRGGDSRGAGGGCAGAGRSEDAGLQQVFGGDDGVSEPGGAGAGYGGCLRIETEALLAAVQALLTEHDLQFLTVTMSEKGISVLRPEGRYHSPARAREVFDVSGAGDTVIATLAAGLAGGLKVETAVELANLAAGIVVGKVGTVPIAQHELIAALTPSSGAYGRGEDSGPRADGDAGGGVAGGGRDDCVYEWVLRPAARRAHYAAGGLQEVWIEAGAGVECGCFDLPVEGADASDCGRARAGEGDGGTGGGGCGGAV